MTLLVAAVALEARPEMVVADVEEAADAVKGKGCRGQPERHCHQVN